MASLPQPEVAVGVVLPDRDDSAALVVLFAPQPKAASETGARAGASCARELI